MTSRLFTVQQHAFKLMPCLHHKPDKTKPPDTFQPPPTAVLFLLHNDRIAPGTVPHLVAAAAVTLLGTPDARKPLLPDHGEPAHIARCKNGWRHAVCARHKETDLVSCLYGSLPPRHLEVLSAPAIRVRSHVFVWAARDMQHIARLD